MNILGTVFITLLLLVTGFMLIIASRVVSRGRCVQCGEYKCACTCVGGENYFKGESN